MHILTTLFSNLVTIKLCIIIMLMHSASLILTPLRTCICKLMNLLEVSRIAGFHTFQVIILLL